MRIIAGTKRGKKLLTPTDDHIRPTADRARESLFNILNSMMEKPLAECSVLDIFSGTGALGLEALSRGAKEAVFVDTDTTLTRKNITLCGFTNCRMITKDARKLPVSKTAYDLILMDAPYNQGLSEQTLNTLCNNGYINEETLIVIETAKDEPLPLSAELQLLSERTYGAARFSFVKKK